MTMIGLLVVLLAAPAPSVEVLTSQDQPVPVATPQGFVLAGQKLGGSLVSLDAGGVTLQGKKGRLQVAAADLLEVRFPTKPTTSTPQPASLVRLINGARLSCRGLAATPRQARLQTAHLGDLVFPSDQVAAIRFGPLDSKVRGAWDELLGRAIKRDRLVIRKNDVLDHLDGVVGEISETVVKFLLDGDELSVPRKSVFGVIFFRKAPAATPVACRASLRGGDSLPLTKVSLKDGRWQATMVGGVAVVLPLERLERLDYSASRVSYLSGMTPRDVEYKPYFDVTWKYRRDRNLDGGPLRLDGKRFARGLALHSKTRLVYLLGGGYRRFQALMGIDHLVGGRGDVHVTIRGDGKMLLEADVKGTDKPRLINLDVTKLREIEIVVDYGGDLDIADHLDLADAKLVR